MIRSTLILGLFVSSLGIAACSDVTGPHRSGSNDGVQIGDRKGKGQDSLPHGALVSFSREARPGDVMHEPEARQGVDDRREAEARREAEVQQEAEARPEKEIRREPENRRAPARDDARRGHGKDDPANHG